jgi:hypothetical protein
MQNGMLKGMVNSGERTLATGGVQRALAPTHKAMSASWWPQHWASGEDLHYPQTFGQLLIQSAKEAAAIARGEDVDFVLSAPRGYMSPELKATIDKVHKPSPDIAGVKEDLKEWADSLKLGNEDSPGGRTLRKALRVIEQQSDEIKSKRLHDRYYSGYHDEAFDEALRVIEQMEAVRRQDLRDFNRLQGDLSRAQARCEELERSAEGYRASYLIAHGERAEAQATIERLEGLMEGIARLANTDPWRTFDGMIQDMGQIDDLARSALAQGRGE